MSQAEHLSTGLWHELDELVQQACILSQAGSSNEDQLRQLQYKLNALRGAAGERSSVGRILHTDVPLVERILPVIDLRLNEVADSSPDS